MIIIGVDAAAPGSDCTVVMWCGEPLNELSHEKLVEIITELATENARLRDENMRRSIKHVNDMAAIGHAMLATRGFR